MYIRTLTGFVAFSLLLLPFVKMFPEAITNVGHLLTCTSYVLDRCICAQVFCLNIHESVCVCGGGAGLTSFVTMWTALHAFLVV